MWVQQQGFALSLGLHPHTCMHTEVALLHNTMPTCVVVACRRVNGLVFTHCLPYFCHTHTCIPQQVACNCLYRCIILIASYYIHTAVYSSALELNIYHSFEKDIIKYYKRSKAIEHIFLHRNNTDCHNVVLRVGFFFFCIMFAHKKPATRCQDWTKCLSWSIKQNNPPTQ